MPSSKVNAKLVIDQADYPVRIDIARLQMREVLAGRWRCCWNCDNWRERVDDKGNDLQAPLCALYNQRPPTEVIVVGCSEWFASGIPF